MSVYADTSFLLSWFVPDANHAQALTRVRSATVPLRLPWTPWNAGEFNNAARTLRARGILTDASLRALPRQVRAALAAADLVATPLPAYNWWAEAEAVSHAHTVTLNVRTLDVLHVAAARVLEATEFLSFDNRQRALARAAGLRVGPWKRTGAGERRPYGITQPV